MPLPLTFSGLVLLVSLVVGKFILLCPTAKGLAPTVFTTSSGRQLHQLERWL
jgi:hypothetical protein